MKKITFLLCCAVCSSSVFAAPMFSGQKATLAPGASVTFKGTMKKKFTLGHENYVRCSNMSDGVKGTADISYKAHADYNEDLYKAYFFPAGTKGHDSSGNLASNGYTQVTVCGGDYGDCSIPNNKVSASLVDPVKISLTLTNTSKDKTFNIVCYDAFYPLPQPATDPFSFTNS